MFQLSRILFLILVVPISCINSGLVSIQCLKYRNILATESSPFFQHLVQYDDFLLAGDVHGTKVKTSPGESDRTFQKSDFWSGIHRNYLIDRIYDSRFKILRISKTKLEVLDPPDLIYPFNYFW